ncbi:MAG: hypothetical protein EZS28_050383, partial [Streblomastix strix]
TCGLRPSLEDSVIILPCGGWDLSALVEAGEIGILRRLLTCPQEIRFTARGWNAVEEREERLWAKRVARKREKKTQQNCLDHFTNDISSFENSFELEPEDQRQEEEEIDEFEDDDICPYVTNGIDGCGLYAVFDGHKGPLAANFFSVHFIDSFLRIVQRYKDTQLREEREQRKLKQKNRKSSHMNKNEARSLFYTQSQEKSIDWQNTDGLRKPPVILAVLQETLRLLTMKLRVLRVPDGSCALVCIVTKDKIFTSNVGDCRAVLVSRFHQKDLTQAICPTQ